MTARLDRLDAAGTLVVTATALPDASLRAFLGLAIRSRSTQTILSGDTSTIFVDNISINR